ncbi:MAG TPA: four helix bundle protein [Bacteroidales bacterium]|nr:four helix bundle protein [Bacteroidales bacterium]HNS46527.1 four helix bundle protein [Bacteroidales bacterium]
MENRLVDFVVRIQEVIKYFPNTYFHTQLANQISRASTSTALNYAEAQSTESLKDFVHKMRLVLKELRECHVALKILSHNRDLDDIHELADLVKENDELVAIFVKSIQTAEKNIKSKAAGTNL